MALAVLLRNGLHGSGSGTATERYMLKCDSFSIQIAKTPIQIPIPQQSPELFDIGIFRPSITVSGIVDTIGLPSGSSPYMDGETIDGQAYKVLYKNRLEDISMTWMSDDSSKIELEVGELTNHLSTANITPGGSPWTSSGDSQSGLNHTGGAIYQVAFQQARFEVSGGEEHYWTYTLQFVAESRTDVSFPT
jgi:hypothetical protein